MGKRRFMDMLAVLVLAAASLDLARRLPWAHATAPSTRPPPASPLDISPRHWWLILSQVVSNFTAHRLMTEAASVTFFMLLALFPAIAALVSLYGLFADPHSVSDELGAVAGVVPGGGLDIIRAQIRQLIANGSGKLGIGLLGGLAVSLWSSNQGSKAMFQALNLVYGEQEKRSYLRLTLVTLLLTLSIILFMLVALAAVVVLPVVLQFLGLGQDVGVIFLLLRWPVLLVMVALCLGATYRFGPSRTHAKWQWITWGSGLAAIAWVVVSVAFSYYVSHFSQFNVTYGSLGAAIGFMTWIWISVMVVLLGAELSAELERSGSHPA